MNIHIPHMVILILRGVLIGAILTVLFGLIYFTPFLDTGVKHLVSISVIAGLLCVANIYQMKTTHVRAHRLAASLNKEYALFVELYQNSPVAYFRTNGSGAILDANGAGLHLLREKRDALIAKNLYAYMSDADGGTAEVARLPYLIQTGSSVSDREMQLTLHDGSMRWVSLSAFPYAGKKESLVALIDITRQKTVDTAKTEFVSLASHQLRTPLSAVRWNLELLEVNGDDPVQRAVFLGKISRSMEKMNQLIRDFLDASKLELGTFATELSTVPFTTFIQGLLEEFEQPIAIKKMNVQSVFPDTQVMLEIDHNLLRMVVTNLISNAIKYTPEGGAIQIVYSVSKDQVVLQVQDTGIGVPREEQSLLFSKLFRASNTKKTDIGGTGLGLYVVKQAVEKMGGTIACLSQEGKGTEFTVTLPIQGI